MMTKMRTAALALAATAALLAAPARAQETRIIDSHDGHTVELRSRGGVEFNDAGDWVASVAPGARLEVREADRGRERRLEFYNDGGVRTRYTEDGRDRPLDARARDWARALIRDAVRESGLGADTRVARLRARGGVGAVLADMATLRTDSGRRTYYRALLGSGTLSDAELARVMDDVGARMGSDSERRLVLVSALDRGVTGGRAFDALLRAAGGMRSDAETRLVLVRAAERARLASRGAADAYFRAVEGMRSDTERRLVLTTIAERNGLADASTRDAFFRATSGMGSDTERRLVLTTAVQRDRSPLTAAAAIAATSGMRSDAERRLVLTAVPTSLLGNARVLQAYRAAVGEMRSDSERRIALSHLMDAVR